MNVIARLAILSLIFTVLSSASMAQKRQTPAKPVAAPTPAPTFDNLVPADSYAIYAEVRDAGQLVRASAINDLLEPVLKLAGPPKEFKSIVKFLNAHAEELMSSRLLVATWNINKTVPETLVAIEFASPEEATKFATPLNEFLPTVLAKPTPDTGAKNATPDPNFHLERLGSLVVITQRPWTLKQLRPAGSKPLAETSNFRTAHSRFSSEPIFAFVDFKLMNREDEERRKQAEEEGQKALEQVKQNPNQIVTTVAEPQIAEQESTAVITPKNTPTPDPISASLSTISNSFFGGDSHIPDALALALSYEGESFDLRGLLISAPGEKVDTIPFWPNVIAGTPLTSQASSIFPADTEMFVMMSLDLPQIYAVLSKPRKSEYTVSKGNRTQVIRNEIESPFKPIEKKLELSIENDLLPLLGNEVAVALPMNGLNVLGISGPSVPQPEKRENEKEADQPANEHAPVLAIAVRDKERLRALLPKLIEGLGFKGAGQFAAPERREDTEVVSYANLFAYAFVGDFLVFSSDAATTRHVVDAYLKQETLASNAHYQAYTRWQPRQLQGQVYVSQSLMEGYRTWAALPTTRISDQMRNFMTSVSMTAQPIAYSISNEGVGPLHELHLPKSLVAMIVASVSGEVNAPPEMQNERTAIGMMYTIAFAEEQYKAKKGAGSYGTLEDLIAAQLFSKETLEVADYKFELTASGDQFEASAVPKEYGKSGRLSLFIDHTRVLRGGDHGGATATASDPPLANQ